MIEQDRMISDVNNQKLRNEMMRYKFPDMGSERIKSQIHRFRNILNGYQLKENETFKSMGNKNCIISKNFIYIIDNLLDHIIEISRSKEVFIEILYHKDLDGELSASLFYILIEYLTESNHNIKTNYSPYNYKSNSIDQICNWISTNEKGEKVIVSLDIALTKNQMLKMINSFDHCLIIDHHPASKEAIMDTDISSHNDFQCVVDLRYSASYLCYLLLNDYIKSYGIDLNDTLPILVSIYDTKAVNTTNIKYIPVTLTKELQEKFISKKKEVKFSLKDSMRTLTKLNSKHFINRTIYIENDFPNEVDNYPLSYHYGLCINLYYCVMGNMPAYSDIFKHIMIDNNLLHYIIDTGNKLLKLEEMKNEVIIENEMYYIATYNNNSIVATCQNFSRIPDQIIENNICARISLDQGVMDSILVKVSIDDCSLQSLDLRSEFRKITKYINGHMKMIIFKIDTNQLNKLIINDIDLNMNKTFESIKFETKGNKLRERPVVYKLFKMISTIIFYAIDNYFQNLVEKKYEII